MTDYTTQSGPDKRSGNNVNQTVYVYGTGAVSLGPRINTAVGTAPYGNTTVTSKSPTETRTGISTGAAVDALGNPITTDVLPTPGTTLGYMTETGIIRKYIYGQPASNSSIFDTADKLYSVGDGTYSRNRAASASTVVENFLAQGGVIPAPPENPSKYKWNLPPHRWSLPMKPSASQFTTGKGGEVRKPVSDAYRRGRIWWKASDPTVKLFANADKGKAVEAQKLEQKNLESRRYGFQFLWNPESFRTSTAVQMDATPTANDRFLAVAGAFPATETISFNIRIDRTNDFACAAGGIKGRPNQVTPLSSGILADNWVTRDYAKRFKDFYRAPGSFFASSDLSEELFTDNIVDLLQRGTIADIEYLYRAINGTGPGVEKANGLGNSWINGRGIATADIGFLMPTLLNIDIGPLSYQGYVTNLEVAHLSFTQEMIPIRSDLTISLNLLATVGIAGRETTG